MKDNRFGGVIWTDHALDRMRERGIPRDFAINSVNKPDLTEENTKGNGVRLLKRIDDKTITLVVTKNERSERVVVSIWMDPPMEGTEDYKRKQRYLEYKKGGILKKIWMTVKRQIGI